MVTGEALEAVVKKWGMDYYLFFYRLFFYCFGFCNFFFNLPISPPLIHTPLLAGGYKGVWISSGLGGSGQKAGKHATGQRRRSMG